MQRMVIVAALGLVLGLAGCDDDGGPGDSAAGPAAATSAPRATSTVPPSPSADCSSAVDEPSFSSSPSGTATAGTGTLRGHLYGVGGPAPGVHEAWSGIITVSGSTGEQRQVEVGPDGAYAVTLPAGHYDIVGRSPHFNGCTVLCHSTHRGPHDVLPGQTTTLDTLCLMA